MTAIDQSIHYFLLNPGKLFACVEAEVWTLNEFETMLSDNTMMDVLPKIFNLRSSLFASNRHLEFTPVKNERSNRRCSHSSVDLTVSEERRDECENGHASQGNCFSRLSSPTRKKRRSVELINNKNTEYVNVN